MRLRTVVFCLALFGSDTLGGQASPYLRLDHWTMPALEHLVSAGVIRDPSPFARPWRRAAVARALADADTAHASDAVRRTVRQLARAFAAGTEDRVDVEAYAGLHAATDARRDRLRPAGEEFIGFLGGVHATVTGGPAVLSAHPYTDRQIRFDPEYTGVRDEAVPGRLTDAYLSLESRYVEIVMGALDRNWGLPRERGFIVSAMPYSYDHLFVGIGPPTVRAEILYTQLDDYLRPPDGATIKRHWAAARFVITPSERVQLSVGQATLWLGSGRGFEWRFLNPLRLTTNTLQDESLPDSINSLYEGQFRVRVHDRIVVSGALMVDDLASGIGTSSAPDRAGASLAVGTTVSGVALELHATTVTALAYRSQQGPEYAVTRGGVGLGRNFADNVEVGLFASVLPAPGLVLAPELAVLWQGEGDPRLPLVLADPSLVTWFEGVTARTVRAGLGVSLAGRGPIVMDGHVGINRTWNANHVAGTTRWDVVAGFRGAVRMDWRSALPVP